MPKLISIKTEIDVKSLSRIKNKLKEEDVSMSHSQKH
jgi:hypothetical protein